MSWRIFVTETASADFVRLDDSTKAAINEELFAWVDAGPPMRHGRPLAELVLYEDELPSGFRITYFVDESEPYVALLRVRATGRPET